MSCNKYRQTMYGNVMVVRRNNCASISANMDRMNTGEEAIQTKHKKSLLHIHSPERRKRNSKIES